MGILYILLGTAFGAIITYLRLQNTSHSDNEALRQLKQKEDALDLRVKSTEENHKRFEEELNSTRVAIDQRESDIHKMEAEIKTIKDQLQEPVNRPHTNVPITPTETPIVNRNEEVERLVKQFQALSVEKSELEIEKASLEEKNIQMAGRMVSLEQDLNEKNIQCDELKLALSKEIKEHQTSRRQLKDQRNSIQALGQKFNSDFENMATKILKEQESHKKKRQ